MAARKLTIVLLLHAGHQPLRLTAGRLLVYLWMLVVADNTSLWWCLSGCRYDLVRGRPGQCWATCTGRHLHVSYPNAHYSNHHIAQVHCWVYNTPPSPNCANCYARCAQAPSQSSLPDTLTTQDDPSCHPIHHICTWRLPERIHFLRCFSIPKKDVVLPSVWTMQEYFQPQTKKLK